MKTIFKFSLHIREQVLHMPVGYKILSVAYQRDELQMWAELDSSDLARPIPVIVSIYGTGWALPEDPGTYIGTVLTATGDFVWHIYAREM
jgi:hypothetical protein